jgi:rod shape-determining protein MreD
VSPNFLLLVVVFIALNAPRIEALFACFLLGLMQDLVSLQPVGMYAFSYGLVAMMIAWAADSVRRSHPLTQITFTFIGGGLLGMLQIVHDYFAPGNAPAAAHIGPRVVAVSVIYTTILAPVVIGLLQLLRGVFGFSSHGRRRR